MYNLVAGVKERFEDTKRVIRTTTQWAKEKGQTSIYKTLHTGN
jgi:hypothetical protein